MTRIRTSVAFAFLIGVACVWAAAQTPPNAPLRYDGHRVVRAELRSMRDARTMSAISDDPWTCGWDGVSPGLIDFRIAPDRIDALRESGVPYTVLIDDVQKLIDNERRADPTPVGVAQRGPGAGWFDDFQPLSAVSTRVDALVAARPDLASRVRVGDSIAMREIFALRISSAAPGAGNPKPAIVIHGCQHAREWITVMATMYLADQLVNTYDSDVRTRRLVDAFEWFIVPVSNPDGYEFTWSSQRLWRKNRRDNGDGSFGVDQNRNWDAGWGGEGASANPQSDTYRGASAFSEPETQALRDFLAARPSLLFHCDVHSFSQLILTPRGYQFMLPQDAAAYHRLSLAMQEAMFGVAGKIFSPGPIYRNIYPASGGACDWVYDSLGAFGTSVELRDEGQTGFVLPAAQIVPASRECSEGLLAAADRLLSQPLDVELIDGPPTRLPAGGSFNLRARVLRGLKRPDFGTPVVLWQRQGRGGPFVAANLAPVGTDESGQVLQGALNTQGAACGSVVQYYLVVTAADGSLTTIPSGGELAPFETVVNEFTSVAASTFETGASATGWLTSDPATANPDTAATGTRWLRGDPLGTVAQAEYDRTPLSGAQCFFTGVNAIGNAGGGDVDGGKTTLVSPVLNLAAYPDAELSFWLWFSNNRGSVNSTDDELTVDVCGDGAAANGAYTWVRALTLRAQAPIAQSTGVWRRYDLRLGQFLSPTSTVRLRVVAADVGIGSYVEAAFDDFTAMGLSCSTRPCPADFNGNGAVTVQDIFDFLAAYFAGLPAADANASGELGVEDLFVFLARWFGPC